MKYRNYRQSDLFSEEEQRRWTSGSMWVVVHQRPRPNLLLKMQGGWVSIAYTRYRDRKHSIPLVIANERTRLDCRPPISFPFFPAKTETVLPPLGKRIDLYYLETSKWFSISRRLRVQWVHPLVGRIIIMKKKKKRKNREKKKRTIISYYKKTNKWTLQCREEKD